jgi:predicted molibdopterin-dependent oxidoreductase YjgC
VAACHTKVLDNMVVRTDSQRVIKARKLNMELVLARHPLDCLVCDRGGECDLQRVAFRVCQDAGEPLPKNRIVNVFGAKPMDIKLIDNRTIIERDLNKCILCRKCIRICDEVMGVKAVCFSKRGSRTEIGTFYGNALECEFCGQCVDICPVGALFHKLSKYKARIWETKEARTICGFCGSGCTMIVRSKRGDLVRVLGDGQQEKGINKYNLCVKGRYGYDFLNNRERLKLPLIRSGGKFKEVSWEKALTYTAEKLRAVKEKSGSDAIAGIGSIWATNEDNYAFQRFMRAVLGTNHIDTYVRMEHAPSIPVLTETFGYPAATVSMDDFLSPKVIPSSAWRLRRRSENMVWVCW